MNDLRFDILAAAIGGGVHMRDQSDDRRVRAVSGNGRVDIGVRVVLRLVPHRLKLLTEHLC